MLHMSSGFRLDWTKLMLIQQTLATFLQAAHILASWPQIFSPLPTGLVFRFSYSIKQRDTAVSSLVSDTQCNGKVGIERSNTSYNGKSVLAEINSRPQLRLHLWHDPLPAAVASISVPVIQVLYQLVLERVCFGTSLYLLVPALLAKNCTMYLYWGIEI